MDINRQHVQKVMKIQTMLTIETTTIPGIECGREIYDPRSPLDNRYSKYLSFPNIWI
jgi:hypothetical protein